MNRPIAGEEHLLLESYGRQVILQDFTLPNGEKEEFFVLKSKHGSPVVILPLTLENQVVTLRQFRFAANDYIVELPGGHAELDEDPEKAIIRELLEETGYRPKTLILLKQACWIDPPSLRVTFTAYLALDCIKEKEPELDRNEIIEVTILPWEEWCEMIFDPDTKLDSKSAVLTLLALPHLRERVQI